MRPAPGGEDPPFCSRGRLRVVPCGATSDCGRGSVPLLRVVGGSVQYEIRAMSFGEVLDTGLRIIRNHFVLLVGISAVVNVPMALFQNFLPQQLAPGGTGTATGIALLFGLASVLVVSPFVQVAITFVIGELYQGRQPTLAHAFREALRIFLPLLGTSLLAGLLMFAGLLLLVIPGVWVILGLVLLSPVMILERRFGTDAIRRSLDLMKGNRLRAFGIFFLTGIVMGVLAFTLGLVGAVLPFAGAIASGLATSVGSAFGIAIVVVLYFEIRCRKEAFEIEHLARIVQASARPTPQPTS